MSRLTSHTKINTGIHRVARHTVHKRVSFGRDFARQMTLLGKLSISIVRSVTEGLPVARNIRQLVFILGRCNCGVTVLSNKFACFNGCLGGGFNVSCICTGRLRIRSNGLAKHCINRVISKHHGTRLLGLVTRIRGIGLTRAVTIKSKTGSLPVLTRTNLNVTFRTGPHIITGTGRSVGAVKLSKILCFLKFGSSCLRREKHLWALCIVRGRRRPTGFRSTSVTPVRAYRRVLGHAVIRLFKYRHSGGTRVREGGDGVGFGLTRTPARRRVRRVIQQIGKIVTTSIPIACRCITQRSIPRSIPLSGLPSATRSALHLIEINSCSIYTYVKMRMRHDKRVNKFGVGDADFGSKRFHVMFGLTWLLCLCGCPPSNLWPHKKWLICMKRLASSFRGLSSVDEGVNIGFLLNVRDSAFLIPYRRVNNYHFLLTFSLRRIRGVFKRAGFYI